jgi:GNAT superfamily N-acetyltransferase
MSKWIVTTYDNNSLNEDSSFYTQLVEKDNYADFFPDLSHEHLKEKRNDFVITLTDKEDDDLIAFTRGYSIWNWLYVRTVWVQDVFRSEGIGSEMLKEIQELARARKCVGIHLNTWNKENLAFYEKNGFHCHGTLEDFPVGHIQYSLSKRI